MHPVLRLGEVWWTFHHYQFRYRSWLFRLDRYLNGRVRRVRFCVLLRFGRRDGMAWYEYDEYEYEYEYASYQHVL